MMDEGRFLTDLEPRLWSPLAKHRLQAQGLFLGNGANAIEVAVAQTDVVPRRTVLLETWKARRGGRAAPVLLVVQYPGGAALCGASGEEPPTYINLEANQVERLCREALIQPDRHTALRFLSQAMPSLETALPGLRNEGLLALHELQYGVPTRDDWTAAKRKATNAVGRRDEKLLRALGFRIERLDNLTYRLRAGDRSTAVAVMLREDESPEAGNDRFNDLSPVSYALKKADDEDLRWAILTQGSRLRLYATEVDAGVGRRGRTETYIECQPPLLTETQLSYLWLLFSAEALERNGSLTRILEDSHRFSGKLAERLRERIYGHVVPKLAQGIACVGGADSSPDGLARNYEMALTVLFRLLFIAYAEDRDLLPYHTNDAYRRRSLKQKARELADCVNHDIPISKGNSHWREAEGLWQAIARGNSEWGVPAYNGGLFADDPGVSEVGAALTAIVLPNEIFEAALRQLLVIETREGVPGPVDFRSLGVREFGTIYEGLLESELAHASLDLALDRKGAYVPTRKGQAAVVAKGEVFLHNRSGARKSSGSYYTKSFAVEHLLDGALEPALDDHFARLDIMDETDAAEAFFDFRIADIAMGSGHFLISAIDRIEKRMVGWLAKHQLAGVRRELSDLRVAANKELGETAGMVDIEDGPLLRRLIARRCIYGVDLNPLSVQLARLSVWIHTFVPGLPLSFLDHNLIQGNALIGVGTINELRETVQKRSLPIFAIDAERLLGAADKPLRRLANLKDATVTDIVAAREAAYEARHSLRDTQALFDLVTALHISDDPRVTKFPFEKWEPRGNADKLHPEVTLSRQALDGLHPLHFPVAFPEVFLRDRPGFDVIVGNPPWEKAKIEEHGFWARNFPGLRGLPKSKQEIELARLRTDRPDLVDALDAERDEAARLRKALVSGAYPEMGTGDPDLYKAFCWRFWRLTANEGGRIGVVLPRSALTAKGSTKFRHEILSRAARVDVTMLMNRAGWVFDDAEHRYTIGLVCIARGLPAEKSIWLRGPYASKVDLQKGVARLPIGFDSKDVLSWNDTASLPLLPDPNSAAVFAQLRKAYRLDMNKDRTGGGQTGELARTGRWMPLCRRGSCPSRNPRTVAYPSGYRAPRFGPKASNDFRRQGSFRRLLAGL